ncbi:hypothetical protein JCM11641_003966 [Rhodosporidiobolus odoratus]
MPQTQLPPELWALIIRAALPSTLRHLGDNNTWNQRATNHVRVVKLLRPRTGEKADGLKTLGEVLGRLPNLKELYLTQVKGFDLSVLRFAPGLANFVGWGFDLHAAPTSPFSLPALAQVSLCGGALQPSATSFFRPDVLPNLQAIAACYLRNGDTEHDTISHLLDPFPPSLFVYTTSNPRCSYPRGETEPYTVYTAREECLDWHEAPFSFSCRTDAIRHLHLTDRQEDSATVEAVTRMIGSDPSLQLMRTLYLSSNGDATTEGTGYKLLCEFGKMKGVEVVFLEEPDLMEVSLLTPELLKRYM